MFKNIFKVIIITIIVLSMSSCQSNTKNENTQSENTQNENTQNSTDTTEKKVSIGILQEREHNALDNAHKGFEDALKNGGYIKGENLEVDFQNAQGDQANLKTISQRFINNKVDLILAIATPAAQAVASETQTIPILVTAVTDLVDAKLVNSNEKPGTNVTGTSDMNPIKEQIDLLLKLAPETKTVGVVYMSGENNSILQANIAKEAIEKLGLKYEERTVTSTNDVQQVIQSIVGKVDALYLPTDNTLASSMAIVSEIANENKIPVICGEPNMVNAGGLATLGIDYYNLGYQTGEMAIKILKGEATPADMPVEFLNDMSYVVNKETVEKIGITVPDELKQYMK